METPRTQSPLSNRSQTTPTGSKKLPQALFQDSSSSSQSSVNTIFPRRKAGQHARLNSKPVVLNETTLRKLFALPLHEAATNLGISATAMKSACRKLGIKKWPYRTVQSTKTAAARRAFASGSSASACSSPSSGTAAPASQLVCAKSEPCSAGPAVLAVSADCLSKDAELLTETMRLFRGRAEIEASESGSESEGEKKEKAGEKSKSSLAMLLN